MEKRRSFKEEFSLMAILLIPVSIAINMVGFQIAQLLRLPIYLDTIGTIMIGMLAGPWVAAVAGLLTNMLNAIFNPVYLPYAFVSIAIGIAAGLLSKHKMMLKPWKVAISGVVLTLVSTIIAAPITVILFGGVTGSTGSAITAVFLTSGQKIWSAVFSSQFLTDFGDKVLSVVICYLIVKSMSSRYLSKLKYGQLYMRKSVR